MVLSVHVKNPCVPVELKLLLEEHISNIGIPLDFIVVLLFCRINDFLILNFFLSGFEVFANQPTVHGGEVSRGRVCGFC